MQGDRMRQVNELVHQHVSEIIAKDIELPLSVFVTLLSVKTSKDLRHADIYITVLPDNKRGTGLRSLQNKAKKIQLLLGKRIKMKYTPQLHFKIDSQEIKAQQVRDIIDSELAHTEQEDAA